MTCRLYLVAPADLGSPARPASAFAKVLTDVLETGAVDCLLLPCGTADNVTQRQSIDLLRPIAQDLGVAVVLEGDAGLARETGCDGVHLLNPKAYRGARKLLGNDAIVGVDCGMSRHLAMEAAEQGADYVAFRRQSLEKIDNGDHDAADEAAPTLEAVLEWWQLMIETPCVAMDAIDADDAIKLATSGADFVALGTGAWSDEDQAVATLKSLAKTLA
ncbi:thiamine phosphate synthase [Denitrobaculum tricleocarpae]|uniref:Thiamine phosphate synthase n=1 Tax=Denitrobaculum tricleocarpae TaxID=2591009 RepID=A0A545TWY5_9PROT|nr:thiamine phosphate synthase [Denitrobaculum tricleocarpae]TQV81727.1 thiamine phosphate synthase [Denitrobaculum tricleocarpae]